MFSNRIANSAKFLQMPTESQLLYFHLNLHADDDGIAESYPIMKMLGISPDAFKVLLVKEYIQQLNEDQVIVITDWLEHNVIRADRKIDSIYKHLLPENIQTIEAKPRSDVKDNSKRLSGQSTDGVGKVRLGKDRINNTSAEESSQDKIMSKEIGEVIDCFRLINDNYNKWFKNTTQREAVKELIEKYTIRRVLKAIYLAKFCYNDKFFPNFITPYELLSKWAKVMKFYKGKLTDKRFIKDVEDFIIEMEKQKKSYPSSKKEQISLAGIKFDYEIVEE